MEDQEIKPEATEQPIYDAGRVMIMVGGPQGLVPMPLPVLFEQLFAVMGDMDRRLGELEAKNPKEDESRIIRV